MASFSLDDAAALELAEWVEDYEATIAPHREASVAAVVMGSALDTAAGDQLTAAYEARRTAAEMLANHIVESSLGADLKRLRAKQQRKAAQ